MNKKLIEQRDFYGVVGHSKASQEIFRLIEEISDSDATVLNQGDSGTGKELIANAIQQISLRKDKPFIKVKGDGMSLKSVTKIKEYCYEKSHHYIDRYCFVIYDGNYCTGTGNKKNWYAEDV